MHIDKSYFTLAEVMDRWGILKDDIIYLAENDRLVLSTRICGALIEFGDFDEGLDGDCFAVPSEIRPYRGILDLYAGDASDVFRLRKRSLTEFRAVGFGYARVVDEPDAVLVRMCDLLVRREERDRVEAECGFKASQSLTTTGFSTAAEYQHVLFEGLTFRFGTVQAQVIAALHRAALDGRPWQNGKVILSEAGSRSMKMGDVFKSQPNWRRLVQSNGRGLYRLAIS
jgi:hypothetical protein